MGFYIVKTGFYIFPMEKHGKRSEGFSKRTLATRNDVTPKTSCFVNKGDKKRRKQNTVNTELLLQCAKSDKNKTPFVNGDVNNDNDYGYTKSD